MKWIFLILALLTWGDLYAQTTFNKRLSFGCGPSVLSSVEVTDSCYYIAGLAMDSSLRCQVSALWVKVDELGNIVRYTLHGDSSERTEVWHAMLQTDVDGNLITGGDLIDQNGLYALLIKWYTQGNLI